MNATSINNMPLSIPTQSPIGHSTTGNFEVPQGLVMKLELSNLHQDQPSESEQFSPPPIFGAHIREGVAVVKDWLKKP
jgi:hypothetical protein